MATILADIWACIDCTHAHANGEYNSDRPSDEPEPLSLIMSGQSVTLGLFSDQHADTCTPADRAEGCDCEHDPYSTTPCGGCGSTLHGERYAMTIWQEESPNPDATGIPS
jgi:ribosomal protein L37AE/L43A